MLVQENQIKSIVDGVEPTDAVTKQQLDKKSHVTIAGVTAGGSGDVVVYATNTGLIGGTALFSTIDHIQPLFDVADPTLAFSKPVVSNGNKTITTNCKKQTFNGIVLLSTNILGSVTVGNAANGIPLTFLIHGTLA